MYFNVPELFILLSKMVGTFRNYLMNIYPKTFNPTTMQIHHILILQLWWKITASGLAELDITFIKIIFLIIKIKIDIKILAIIQYY